MGSSRVVDVVIGLVIDFKKQVYITNHLRTKYDENTGQPYMSSSEDKTYTYVLNGKHFTGSQRFEFIDKLESIDEFEYYCDEYSAEVFGIPIYSMRDSDVFILNEFDMLDYAETLSKVKQVAKENGLDADKVSLMFVSKIN